jgi:hypothetical protein
VVKRSRFPAIPPALVQFSRPPSPNPQQTICCPLPSPFLAPALRSAHGASRRFLTVDPGRFVPNRPAVARFSAVLRRPSPTIRAPRTQHDRPSITPPFASQDISPPREISARTLTAKPTKRVRVFLRPVSNGPTAKILSEFGRQNFSTTTAQRDVVRRLSNEAVYGPSDLPKVRYFAEG